MVLSAIWKTYTSGFFKDYQNCASPKDEYN